MINLSTEELFELGSFVSDKLIKKGIEKDATITILVDETSFRKIDEDIFFKLKKQEVISDDEFIPSESEINLSFPKLNILIKTDS